MLLLTARLEPAGLDRRKLPASLLPGVALARARFLDGPPPDLVLPEAPPDAAGRVARLWAGTQVGLRHDGTAADALRRDCTCWVTPGCRSGRNRGLLLPALYAALVAGEYEELADAGQRAVAWALGLAETSPLVPVTDVLLVAPERGVDVDAVLGCLYAVAGFEQPVAAEDRRWHGSPGTDLVDLAFEAGHRQVVTLDGKTLRLDAGSTELLQGQVRRFEEKFGRPPDPDDPLFFDPDADEPQPVSALHWSRPPSTCSPRPESPGLDLRLPQHRGLLPRPDGVFLTDADEAEWTDAVDRYNRLHPDTALDHDIEAGKLRAALAVIALAAAANDPAYLATLIDRLHVAGEDDDRSP